MTEVGSKFTPPDSPSEKGFLAYYPIKEITLSKKGIKWVTRQGRTFTYSWPKIRDAKLETTETVYLRGGGDGFNYEKKIIFINTPNEILKINISQYAADVKNQSNLLTELNRYIQIKEENYISFCRSRFFWPILILLLIIIALSKWLPLLISGPTLILLVIYVPLIGGIRFKKQS